MAEILLYVVPFFSPELCLSAACSVEKGLVSMEVEENSCSLFLGLWIKQLKSC